MVHDNTSHRYPSGTTFCCIRHQSTFINKVSSMVSTILGSRSSKDSTLFRKQQHNKIAKPNPESSFGFSIDNHLSCSGATETDENMIMAPIFGSFFDRVSFRWGYSNIDESSQVTEAPGQWCKQNLMKRSKSSIHTTTRKYEGCGAVGDAYNAMRELVLEGYTVNENKEVLLCHSEADVLKAIEAHI